jgi:hypothetical protein
MRPVCVSIDPAGGDTSSIIPKMTSHMAMAVRAPANIPRAGARSSFSSGFSSRTISSQAPF